MEPIIKPVERHLLLQELTPERKLRDTVRAGNELYIFNAHQAPALMREVGRLREESFRAAGGCSGRSMDIDKYDTMANPYRQLIVWDPKSLEIVGGYRFLPGREVRFNEDGTPLLATAELFDLSEEFLEKYLPATLELGRSFVSPGYQSSATNTKSIFVLDNLWDGLATIMMLNPYLSFYFGKVTIHPGYDRKASSLIMHFLQKHYGDRNNLVWPKKPVEPAECEAILCKESAKEDYLILKRAISELGFNIPPLFNSYINLASTMTYFGFSECHDLIGAIEGGMMIKFDDIYPDKKERHLKAFFEGKVNANL